jgi:hypothetical protein
VEDLARNEHFIYQRINPDRAEPHERKYLLQIELDEWVPHKPKNGRSSGWRTIETITNAFNAWFAGNQEIHDSFTKLAQHLVETRRRRARDMQRWESYATAAQYVCNIDDNVECLKKLDHKFTGLAEFHEHLSNFHSLSGPEFEAAKRNGRRPWLYKEP